MLTHPPIRVAVSVEQIPYLAASVVSLCPRQPFTSLIGVLFTIHIHARLLKLSYIHFPQFGPNTDRPDPRSSGCSNRLLPFFSSDNHPDVCDGISSPTCSSYFPCTVLAFRRVPLVTQRGKARCSFDPLCLELILNTVLGQLLQRGLDTSTRGPLYPVSFLLIVKLPYLGDCPFRQLSINN